MIHDDETNKRVLLFSVQVTTLKFVSFNQLSFLLMSDVKKKNTFKNKIAFWLSHIVSEHWEIYFFFNPTKANI